MSEAISVKLRLATSIIRAVAAGKVCSVSTIHYAKIVQIRHFFLVRIFSYLAWTRSLRSISPYSVKIPENADQKKLRIWAVFTQCYLHKYSNPRRFWKDRYKCIALCSCFKLIFKAFESLELPIFSWGALIFSRNFPSLFTTLQLHLWLQLLWCEK